MTRLVIGVNSGTSLDALDIGLFGISKGGKRYCVTSINSMEYRFPTGLANSLWNLATGNTSSIETLLVTDRKLAFFISSRITSALRKFGLSADSVDIIGSHGQTVAHLPEKKLTLQIGDPAIIAAQTKITTVGDFRKADIGALGQGAPLSPAIHGHLFACSKSLAVLNIGGIANVSYIPKEGSKRRPFGFDCGPGNIIMDQLAKLHFNKRYDRNGAIARRGRVSDSLLETLMTDRFVNANPPKSTGREHFGEDFIKINFTCGLDGDDLIRTAAEFSAQAIAENLERHIPAVEKLIVCGGGALNKFLVERITAMHEDMIVETSEEHGLHPKLVECAGFALLAVMAIDGVRSDLRTTTGAKEPVVLGKICYG